MTRAIGDRQVLPPCQGKHDIGSHQLVALDDSGAIVKRREFLEYRLQQLRRYSGTNGHASLQQFADRVPAGYYQQSAEVQSSQAKRGIGDRSTGLVASHDRTWPAPHRAVEPHEGTAKFRLKNQQ